MTVHLRDDMDGAADGSFVGRVPNISPDGTAWIPGLISGGEWYEWRTDGTGNAALAVNPSADAGGGWALISVPEMSNLRIEWALRGAGGNDLAAHGGIGVAKLVVNLGFELTLDIMVWSTQFNIAPPSPDPAFGTTYPGGMTLGQAGTLASWIFEWADGVMRLTLNGNTIATETPVTQFAPHGVSVDMTVCADNLIDYIDISGDSVAAAGEWHIRDNFDGAAMLIEDHTPDVMEGVPAGFAVAWDSSGQMPTDPNDPDSAGGHGCIINVGYCNTKGNAI